MRPRRVSTTLGRSPPAAAIGAWCGAYTSSVRCFASSSRHGRRLQPAFNRGTRHMDFLAVPARSAALRISSPSRVASTARRQRRRRLDPCKVLDPSEYVHRFASVPEYVPGGGQFPGGWTHWRFRGECCLDGGAFARRGAVCGPDTAPRVHLRVQDCSLVSRVETPWAVLWRSAPPRAV